MGTVLIPFCGRHIVLKSPGHTGYSWKWLQAWSPQRTTVEMHAVHTIQPAVGYYTGVDFQYWPGFLFSQCAASSNVVPRHACVMGPSRTNCLGNEFLRILAHSCIVWFARLSVRRDEPDILFDSDCCAESYAFCVVASYAALDPEMEPIQSSLVSDS